MRTIKNSPLIIHGEKKTADKITSSVQGGECKIE
jgi:hypothetical protein